MTATATSTFVIVGAGLAGAKAAETLRAEGFDGRVCCSATSPTGPTSGRRCPRATCAATTEREQPVRPPGRAGTPSTTSTCAARRRSRLDRAERPPARAGRRRARSATTSCCWPPAPPPRRLRDARRRPGRRALPAHPRRRRRRCAAAVARGPSTSWSSAPAGSASRSPPPPASTAPRSTVVEPQPAAAARVLGPEVGDGLRATCTATTASTCALGTGVDRHPRRTAGSSAVVDRRRRHRSTPTWSLVGVGVGPGTELAEAAGLEVDNGISSTSSCAPSAPGRLRRRRRRQRLAPAATGSTCASSTGPTPSTRARPRRRTMLGRHRRLRPAALLLHRPVRPRHGVRPGYGRPGDDQVVVRGDLGRPRVHRLLAQRTAGSSPGMNVNVWDVVEPIQGIDPQRAPVDPGASPIPTRPRRVQREPATAALTTGALDDQAAAALRPSRARAPGSTTSPAATCATARWRAWSTDGIRGVTSNPTIFAKAIERLATTTTSSSATLVAGGRTGRGRLLGARHRRHHRRAAPSCARSSTPAAAPTGSCRVEVAPELAHDTDGTIDGRPRRCTSASTQPNLFVKIPATAEGVPADPGDDRRGPQHQRHPDLLPRPLRRGHRGLPRRASRRSPTRRRPRRRCTASPRSSSAGSTPRSTGASTPIGTDEALALRGKAAVAQAKLAYQLFRERFSGAAVGARWPARGAPVQRPLWASTSTKNPAYPDTLYVDSLIGPDTVNTLPEATIDAFEDHGTLARTIDADVDDAARGDATGWPRSASTWTTSAAPSRTRASPASTSRSPHVLGSPRAPRPRQLGAAADDGLGRLGAVRAASPPPPSPR